MAKAWVTMDNDVQSERCPLLKYIQQRWMRLLAHERLDVELLVDSGSPRRRWEIFVGDEFRRAGKLHVDIVVKACDDAPDELASLQALPTVLVFEKHTPYLVQHELNGLRLETPVLVRLAS